MNENSDAVVSAATSCLLYVREIERSGPGEMPVSYSNELIQRWLSSAERRNFAFPPQLAFDSYNSEARKEEPSA